MTGETTSQVPPYSTSESESDDMFASRQRWRQFLSETLPRILCMPISFVGFVLFMTLLIIFGVIPILCLFFCLISSYYLCTRHPMPPRVLLRALFVDELAPTTQRTERYSLSQIQQALIRRRCTAIGDDKILEGHIPDVFQEHDSLQGTSRSTDTQVYLAPQNGYIYFLSAPLAESSPVSSLTIGLTRHGSSRRFPDHISPAQQSPLSTIQFSVNSSSSDSLQMRIDQNLRLTSLSSSSSSSGVDSDAENSPDVDEPIDARSANSIAEELHTSSTGMEDDIDTSNTNLSKCEYNECDLDEAPFGENSEVEQRAEGGFGSQFRGCRVQSKNGVEDDIETCINENNKEAAEVESLRVLSLAVADDDAWSCDICLNAFEVGDVMTWSRNENCSHVFHFDCVTDWLLRKATCPSCRQDYILSAT